MKRNLAIATMLALPGWLLLASFKLDQPLLAGAAAATGLVAAAWGWSVLRGLGSSTRGN